MREEATERARVEPAAARRQEERVVGAACKRRPRLVQVTRDPMRGLLAERHDALLRALPAYAHVLLLEVDVGEVEPDRLGGAEPGRIHELDERAVSQLERALAVEPLEHRIDLGRL